MHHTTLNTRVRQFLSKLFANVCSYSLLRLALGALGLKIGSAALAFINGVLLARLLGPVEFGLYSLIFSIVNLTATLGGMGLPIFITREVATSFEHALWGQLKGQIRIAHLWMLLFTLTILGLGLGLVLVLLDTNLMKLNMSWVVIIMATLLVPLIVLNQLRASILRGLDWVILADLPELLLRPFTMFILLVGLYFTHTPTDILTVLSIQSAIIVFTLVVGSWWLLTRQPEQLKYSTSEPPPFSWLLGALPFFGIAVIGMVESQISLYMLGYLRGAKQVGLFQVANQIVGLISIGLVAVNVPLQPKLASAWSRTDKRQIQKLITETARIGSGISVIAVLVILIFAEVFLGLYGSQYIEAAYALRILAIGQLFNAAAGSCGALLMMTGHQKVVVLAMVIAMLLNCGVAYWAIPFFGVAGAAFAATFGMIFLNIFCAVYAMFRLDFNTTVFYSSTSVERHI
jgi:O-antigen/teichoic acid export membrane protein